MCVGEDNVFCNCYKIYNSRAVTSYRIEAEQTSVTGHVDVPYPEMVVVQGKRTQNIFLFQTIYSS